MSVSFTSISWNRQKRWYDLAFGCLLLLALGTFVVATLVTHPAITLETLIIRSTSVLAFLLLHLILAIGPLSRLNSGFLCVLYNRRHLGVTMFLLAAVHGIFAIIQFHGGGTANPFLSAFTAYAEDYSSFLHHLGDLRHFPFELFGLLALMILLVMAVTSHDLWLKHLGASLWKALHMGVYLAYALILIHVFLGALQSEQSPLYPIVLGAGFVGLLSLHLLAYGRERSLDRSRKALEAEGFFPVARLGDLRPEEGKVVVVQGERFAVYVHQGRVFALSNVCRHQGGPLGEGRILYDCVTCPWHGYQYKPEDGCSPPPFTEVVPTYPTRVIQEVVYLNPQPNPWKSVCPGAECDVSQLAAPSELPFYVGWQDRVGPALKKYPVRVFLGLAIGLPAMLWALATNQNPIDSGGYEYGVERLFQGVIYATPIPIFHFVPQEGADDPAKGQNVILVGQNKFSPPAEFMNNSAGHLVSFRGSYLYWHGMTMVEINDPSSLQLLGKTPAAAKTPDFLSVGAVTLTGELVDTKCFLGAMRPATGKIHRGCAVVCLSGGVPPGLLVHDRQGSAVVVMLAGLPGRKLEFDVQWAARVVSAKGTLEIYNGIPVLRTGGLVLQN